PRDWFAHCWSTSSACWVAPPFPHLCVLSWFRPEFPGTVHRIGCTRLQDQDACEPLCTAAPASPHDTRLVHRIWPKPLEEAPRFPRECLPWVEYLLDRSNRATHRFYPSR